jgi:hypothetical protein
LKGERSGRLSQKIRTHHEGVEELELPIGRKLRSRDEIEWRAKLRKLSKTMMMMEVESERID